MKLNLLTVRNVTFAYDKINILEDVSFDGRKGEILGIIGPNGSGKTTLIKLLFDILERKQGDILVGGIDNRKYDVKQMIYYLTSDDELPHFLSGDEYIRMMCRLYEKSVNEQDYNRLLKYYNMEDKVDDLIENYSHGMKKKIQLIVAFLIQVDITVIDETLNGIDIEAEEVSKTLLKKLASKDKLVIVCSHNLKLAEEIADRTVVLYNGVVRNIIDMQEVKSSLSDLMRDIIGFEESNYEL